MKHEPSLHFLTQKYMHANLDTEKIYFLLGKRGFSHEQIQKELLWLSNDTLTNDAKKLRQYFAKNIKQGHSLDTLVEHAVAQGIESSIISRALSELEVGGSGQDQSDVAISPRHLVDDKDSFVHPQTKQKTFRFADALLLLPVSASVLLSFYNPLVPFAAVVLVSVYLLRVIGVHPKGLAYACLLCAVSFWALAVLFIPGMIGLTAVLLFALAALFLFLP